MREYRDGLIKGGRTPGTANGVVKILRAPLNAARRQGLIAHNPAEGVEMLATDTNEKECFTPKQVKALVKAAEGDWKGLILAGYYTGARLGDLADLQWESVDLKREAIVFTQGKTGREIEIPLHPEFKRWLSDRAGSKKPKGRSGLPRPPRGRNPGTQRAVRPVRRHHEEGQDRAEGGARRRARTAASAFPLVPLPAPLVQSAMANAGVTQEIRQRLTGTRQKRSTTATPTRNLRRSGKRGCCARTVTFRGGGANPPLAVVVTL